MEAQEVINWKTKLAQFRVKYWTEEKCRIYRLAARGIIFAILVLVFFINRDMYTVVKETGTHYYKKRMVGIPLIAVFCTVLPLLRRRIPWPDWLKTVLMVLTIEVVPIITIEVCESLHGNLNFLFNSGAEDYLYTYILVFTMFLVAYMITNRVRLSLLLVHIVVLVFSIANYYIFIFRNEPILAADLFVLGTAMNVASSYEITINYEVFLLIFSMPVLSSLLAFIPGAEKPWNWKKRLIFAVFTLFVTCSIVNIFALSKYPKNRGINVKMFGPEKSYAAHGQVLTFVRSFYYTQVDKPRGYSVAKVEEIAEQYPSDETVNAETVSEENPNLIVIMNEAFTDLSALGNLDASEDCLSYIHSLKGQDNVIYGTMYTSVFGGHTANTEYEVLTGNSSAFLPSSSVAYSLFVRDEQPSAAWNMTDLGYDGLLAFHPHKANGYNRNKVYPLFGFSDFISKETIADQVTESDYLRNLVSDECDYKHLIRLYEETRAQSDDPFYMFNVTMQNHGGYEEDYDNMTKSITLGGEFADEEEAIRYVNLIDKADEAFEALTEYFKNVQEPTVIVMFGDHEPGLSGSFFAKLFGRPVSELSKEEKFLRYQTPLIVWANYDINAGGQHDAEFKDVSANYLSAKIANLLNQPLTGYQKFLLEMSEEIPVLTMVGYLDADGTYYSVTSKSSPYYDKLLEYHMLIYNNQFDRKNRLADIFYLSGGKKNNGD